MEMFLFTFRKLSDNAAAVVKDFGELGFIVDMQKKSVRVNQSLIDILQAAVNSRDDERDRLRKELKFAQEELNRLRRIQKAAAPLLEKDLIAGRPASIVSEASTVSGESGDETKEGEQTDEQETGMVKQTV